MKVKKKKLTGYEWRGIAERLYPNNLLALGAAKDNALKVSYFQYKVK